MAAVRAGGGGLLGLLVAAAMFAPMGTDADHAVSNPLGISPAFDALVLVMVAVIGLVVTPVAVVGLVLRQRRAVGAERAQLQWLSLAVVVTIVLGVAAAAARQPVQEALWALAFSAIPVGIVIAVVRYRLFDVEVVLNRTIVYGLLTAVVLAGYFGAVVGVGEAAQRTGLVAVVVLALLAAAARDRVQRGVDRLLFGYRKDPYAVVSRVGRRLDDASGPLDALGQLTVELRTALRLPSAEVIPDDPGLPPVESGRSVAGTVDVPVTVQGRHVATLRIGRRHNGERFRPDELSALTDVARQAGALVQAAALIAELQRSRETLVTAREEERRRLRRDLHDGVGPELAGLALQLDSLASRLAADTDLADRASVLRDRMRQTVAGVRRVVDDLRPPALDELGLADALRQHLAVYAATPAGTPDAGIPDAGTPDAGTSAAPDAVRVARGRGGRECLPARAGHDVHGTAVRRPRSSPPRRGRRRHRDPPEPGRPGEHARPRRRTRRRAEHRDGTSRDDRARPPAAEDRAVTRPADGRATPPPVGRRRGQPPVPRARPARRGAVGHSPAAVRTPPAAGPAELGPPEPRGAGRPTARAP